MFIKCILLLFALSFIESAFSYYRPSASTCAIPRIKNGRARPRQRGSFLRFSCSFQYTLVGNKYATCRYGEWDVPTPVCVRTGCQQLEEVKNAVNTTSHNSAWVVFFCLPGHQLVGSPVIYCDGTQWNSTAPECYESSVKTTETDCDFEQPSICGWKPDEYQDFDWRRLNKKTASPFLQTGPQYDHTYGKNGSGYYMYIESMGGIANNTARLMSPVYEADLAKDGCFVFWYHMFGRTTGGLVVYQKPAKLSTLKLQEPLLQKNAQKLFEQWGDQGNEWHKSIAMLSDFGDDFQIVIEGIRGKNFVSNIAIDDVSIQHGENCSTAMVQATTPPSVLQSTTEDHSSSDTSVIPSQTEELVTITAEALAPHTKKTTIPVSREPTTATTTTTTTTIETPATTTIAAEMPSTTTTVTEMPSTTTTATEKPATTITAAEKPATITTTAEKPATTIAAAEKPATTIFAAEKPATITTTAEKPATTIAAAEKSATTTTAAEKPATTTNAAEKPATTTTAAEKPATTTTAAEKPTNTTTAAEKPATTTTAPEKPATTTAAAEKPATTTTDAEKPANTITITEIPANKSPTSTTNTKTTPRPTCQRKIIPTTSKSKTVTIDVSLTSSTISVVRTITDHARVKTENVCNCAYRDSGEG